MAVVEVVVVVAPLTVTVVAGAVDVVVLHDFTVTLLVSGQYVAPVTNSGIWTGVLVAKNTFWIISPFD